MWRLQRLFDLLFERLDLPGQRFLCGGRLSEDLTAFGRIRFGLTLPTCCPDCLLFGLDHFQELEQVHFVSLFLAILIRPHFLHMLDPQPQQFEVSVCFGMILVDSQAVAIVADGLRHQSDPLLTHFG